MKICGFIEKYMAFVVLAVALISLFFHSYFMFIKMSYINYLLMLVMFGMGLTLNLNDFKVVFTAPKNILIGCLSQYLIMPLIALILGKIFGLSDELLIGVILVGACPGGTASNVITYLSKGDTAFSIGMTAVNTLLSPIVTPFIVYSLLNTVVKVDILNMFISIVNVVILPIILGLIINKFFKKYIDKCVKMLPAFSILAISVIISSVVSHNAEQIFSTGLIIFLIVILHNIFGYFCGFAVAKLLKMDDRKVKALSIEVGMQNSGLATSLAATAFPAFALATVPGAIFSVWHNLSGAMIANIYSGKE